MPLARSPSPEIQNAETLREALSSALQKEGDPRELAAIVRSERCVYASTFPAEILHCKFADGTERQIFCKYQTWDLPQHCHAHHRGVAHEATIYREILRRVHVSTPVFLGVHSSADTQKAWLFLEYLAESHHLNKLDVKEGLLAAARWIGRFHAENERRASHFAFLSRFDAAYYAGWIDRTLELTSSFQQRFPWLPRVCAGFMALTEHLLAEPLTVIHSEFYPKNILVSNGKIYPVDWESAAIGAGEIDLASLTEGWGPLLEKECEAEYARARWGDASPGGFHTRAKMARAYVEFRWLGDQKQWKERGPWRVERLGVLAKELGLSLG